MKIILSVAFTLFLSVVCIAQMPGGVRGMSGQSMNMGHFYGKVMDSSSNRPIESASIQLIQTKLDSVTKKRKDVVIDGMLTDKKGEFSLENLAVVASYKLRISAIGYKPFEKKVFFQMKTGGDMSQMMNAVDKDLGNIKLETDTRQLQEVNVTGSRSALQMNIDRKVFNVEKNLTSAGGTAVDVMKSVPSVNVDIDGNVTLRNAAPQIFVDGRPTTLSLDQIPSDAIQSIEIITNPSAKFDASGGGSGILNIVLKKARKTGYNGSLRANIDSRLKFGLGGDINVRQGKVNWFGNAMYNQRKSISEATTNRIDFIPNGKAFLNQNSNPKNEGYFAFLRTGFDYFIDNRNTITIGGAYVRGVFNSEDLININRDTTLTNYSSSEYGIRTSEGRGMFRNLGSTFSYKHNFAKSGKELTADANMNFSNNENNGAFSTQYFNTDNSVKTNLLRDKSTGSGETKFITFQTDFTNPITDKIKIEMGARGAIRNFNSNNENLFYNNTTGTYITIPALANNYKFKDQVYAGYVTFSQAIKKFTYQLGMRVESSKYEGTLVNKGVKFNNEYPFSFFPSVFLTQKINAKQDLQLNYSRKINRPNFFQLLPYIDFSDSLNLSVGNPNLVPEFTNLVELSYQIDLNKGNNLLSTLYFRNTNDLITRSQYRDKNPNPAKTDSVIFNSYANANNSMAYGLELTSKNKLTKWWDLTANVNIYNSKINGNNIESNLSSERVSWFGKLNNSFKFPKNYSIQLTADYQSKTILPQSRGGGGGGGMMMFGGGQLSNVNGYTKPNYGVDIAVKKDFLKNNAASVSLSMNDIFRTKVYSTHSESVYLVQDNIRRRDPQLLRLNFNWRFGKFDVSLFKRKNIKGEMEGMQNGMQGIQ
ncbi:outer membrane beta-barrel family protein [soil metagenome]